MLLKNLKIIALAVMVVLIPACSMLFPAEEKTTPPALIEPESFTYTTEVVKIESIAKSIKKNGTFTSLLQYNLTFEKRGGYITELNMIFNDRVKAGDLLASIDTDDLERQIAEQTMAVEIARIDYNNAVGQVNTARENYDRIASTAKIEKDIAKRDVEKAREQYNKKIDDLDPEAEDYEYELTIAKLELSKAESEYKRKISDIDSRVAAAAAAASSQADEKALVVLRQAEMKLSNLREEYDKMVIRSPIDGIITYIKDLSIGSYVDARSTVVTVADDKELIVILMDTARTDTFFSDFPVGAKVSVWTAGAEYNGTIVYTPADSPINKSVSNYPYVLIDVENIPLDKVTIGTVAVVVIDTDYRENVMTVPSNAVHIYGDYSFVRVLEDGVSIERPVEVGLVTPTRIEIIKGLSVGETVIIR